MGVPVRSAHVDLLRELGCLGLASRLRRLGEQLQEEVSTIYTQHGVDLRARWFLVLRALGAEPVAMVDLAAQLGLEYSQLNQAVRALEQRGFAVCGGGASGRGPRLVTITPRGAEVLQRLQPLWRSVERATFELVEESQAAGLLAQLERLEMKLGERPLRERLEPSRDFEIVQFRPELAPAFRALNLEWLEETFEVEPLDREVLERPAEVVIAAGGEILFALAKGEVVGTCALMFHDLDDAAVAELTKMAVRPAYRRRGIGRGLARAAIGLCARRGIDRLFLFTSPQLPVAMAFFRSLGFSPVPAPPVRHPGYARQSVVMSCELAAGWG